MAPAPQPGRCPISHEGGQWVARSHETVRHLALDPTAFSSAVSRFLQIPNALDGPEHARWRGLVDTWFTPSRISALAPALATIAAELVAGLRPGEPFDAVEDLGARFAVRATCAWLGWPHQMEGELLAWMTEHEAATRSGEYARTAASADAFDEIIRRLTAVRRDAGADAPADVTTELVRATIGSRPLEDPEIVSILRNWTAGDLSSMALCVGVVLRHLADHPDVQTDVRRRAEDSAALDRAIDEILRIDDPFVANRRVATRDEKVDDVLVLEGERVLLHWRDANRDPARFEDPDRYAPEDNAPHNLVYGLGPHVCPGRGLATLELRLVVQAVLAGSTWLEPGPGAVRQEPPQAGWRVAPVVMLAEDA